MKQQLTNTFGNAQRSFAAFSTGQKVTAVLGTLALLLGCFMVFQWASKPTYTPLFSNLSGPDAAAVVDKLEADGISYTLANNGSTIMVPEADVYKTRISMSGAGIPSNSTTGGYHLLDESSLSSSQFQEQTTFKRAMEGELNSTIEAIDGVNTAVVHLALPKKEVFTDNQAPATASVLVATSPGTKLNNAQVQAIVHLVASSVDNLDPDQVTVADQTGTLLSGSSDTSTGGANGRNQAVEEFEAEKTAQLQAILDRVVGPGNGTAQYTADLNFDKTQVESKTYEIPEGAPKLASKTSSEVYNGPGGYNGIGGTVGPDGQMDGGYSAVNGAGNGNSDYTKREGTSDSALNTTVQRSEKAPGSINTQHVGLMLDQRAAAGIDTRELAKMVAASIGINRQRGDTIQVTALPFDRTAEQRAAAELNAAAKAKAEAEAMTLYRNIAIAAAILLLALFLWWRSRRKEKARAEATNYLVEQIQATRPVVEPEPTLAAPAPEPIALEPVERSEEDEMRDELVSLVESQPEDVAALLRGWLVDNR